MLKGNAIVEKAKATFKSGGGTVLRQMFSENPVFCKAIGLAPVLAVSVSLKNGLLLGAVTFVVMSIMGGLSSLLYKRLPVYLRASLLTLIASVFVTLLYKLSIHFVPNVTTAVGIFLPLVAVNGIILSKAAHFDSKNDIATGIFDGIGNGAGFALAIIIVSAIREILGNGTLYDKVLPGMQNFHFNFILLPPGAFLLLAVILAFVQYRKQKKEVR